MSEIPVYDAIEYRRRVLDIQKHVVVGDDAVPTITGTPGVTLAAARSITGEPRADRSRVADEGGRVASGHAGRPGHG